MFKVTMTNWPIQNKHAQHETRKQHVIDIKKNRLFCYYIYKKI